MQSDVIAAVGQDGGGRGGGKQFHKYGSLLLLLSSSFPSLPEKDTAKTVNKKWDKSEERLSRRGEHRPLIQREREREREREGGSLPTPPLSPSF